MRWCCLLALVACGRGADVVDGAEVPPSPQGTPLSAYSTWYYDADGDGHGDPRRSILSTGPVDPYVQPGDDCNDRLETVYPGAPEVCDGEDNDCDGAADADDPDVRGHACTYEDADGDGFGDPATVSMRDRADGERVEVAGDCDDGDAHVHPHQPDLSGDGVDSDCDGDDSALLDLDVVASARAEDDRLLTAVGDVDGDGFPDVAMGSSLYSGPAFLVGAEVTIGTLPAGARLLGSAGDADGDGHADVWVEPTARGEQVALWSGASLVGGSPTALVSEDVPGVWGWLPLGDTDSDDVSDVGVFTTTSAGRVLATFGSGSSATSLSAALATIELPDVGADAAYDVGDVDGDGLDELALLGSSGVEGQPQIWLVSGDVRGDVAVDDVALWSTAESSPSCAFRVGDLDGDGLDDLATDIGVWDGPVSTWAATPGAPVRVLAPAGDVDGDGLGDLWLPPERDGFATLALGPVESGAAETVVAHHRCLDEDDCPPTGVYPAALGDFDGDGLGDAAVVVPSWREPYPGDLDAGPAIRWLVPGAALLPHL